MILCKIEGATIEYNVLVTKIFILIDFVAIMWLEIIIASKLRISNT
jgi:hypothetical protein